MDVLHMTSRKRETYEVRIESSLLWESALGIAAITNTRLIDTLEKPKASWDKLKKSLSKSLIRELDYVEKNNTWKSLLLLLHQRGFGSLQEFITFLDDLEDEEIKYLCIPYIGLKFQELRMLASKGDVPSRNRLKDQTDDNPYYPGYIEFICTTNVHKLKKHLMGVMTRWYEEVILPEQETLSAILTRDRQSKVEMSEKLNPEALVEWATGGITYLPEPAVHTVLLIPQSIYRPWNVEGDVEGVKVFYYPVANESIYPDDKDMPSYFLVQKHKALGDEARLRMVKFLKGSERTLQEITNELGMGKSTVHHHLKILRSARLVETLDGKYRLKENAVQSLSNELKHYLKKE
ncbi:ArsR family transcriptional regulator [Rossellomorea vietnamensis]|uniref:ArsR/SmtB family transcription factor n=1 Tax=Rossellomorea vietnamensis TaxID=218284 RepID=UPI001CCFC0F4|nr:metalloregulator ArsR/SmtB family transcription factor [Rossellomorea vietnamensis]MCA0148416.1 ArsR family transcriptional regulator [Rossellomorea vietnamensis]